MDYERLTTTLRKLKASYSETDWPSEAVRTLVDAGCFQNIIPPVHGGAGAGSQAQLATYESIASGNVSLALIATQHDAAAEVLIKGSKGSIASEVLDQCGQGKALLTVGISQITTSKRHGEAAMRASRDGDDFILDGVMPWVTSAQKADFIVTAAVMADGNQLLACVPTSTEGVSIGDPMKLMALQASWTSEVRCHKVRLSHRHIVRGPMKSVLSRRAPVKGLTVSSVGIGLAANLIDEIRKVGERLPESAPLFKETIEPCYREARQQLFDAAGMLGDPASEVPALAIRTSINHLLHRLAATLMTLAKGSGFLTSNPAERLHREAAFFLVWSAPPAVQLETIQRMWGEEPES